MDTQSAELPAWRRQTRGEHRWPAALTVLAAVLLQFALPDRIEPQLGHVLAGLELALLAGLVVADPYRVTRESTVLRRAALTLMALVVVSNGWSAVLLIGDILGARPVSAVGLLTAGGVVWLTNVLAIGLVHWELDRGGPAARAAGREDHPDLLFPQMQSPELVAPDWEPTLLDYLYLSYTNATAFSPTDVLPLSRRAKLIMAVQSAVALGVVVLVLARAVNVLS